MLTRAQYNNRLRTGKVPLSRPHTLVVAKLYQMDADNQDAGKPGVGVREMSHMKFTIFTLLMLGAFSPALAQTNQQIRKANFKTLVRRDAIRTMHDFWGNEDWVLPENIREFHTTIAFGDLTGDRSEEGVILVSYNLGGSGEFTGVFVYSLAKGVPRLIATVKGGDRAHGGLKSALVQNGKLFVESYRPDKDDCNACYGSILITRYEWQGGKLVSVGATPGHLPGQNKAGTRRRKRPSHT
jgi:hypothetical protein